MTASQPAAAEIARALKARRSGGGWMAACVAHEDRTPSLSIRDGDNGKPLIHCFGGCSQDVVIDALRKRGLWHDGPTATSPAVALNFKPRANPMTDELTAKELETIATCREVWGAAGPAENTPAQLYLQCRGIVSVETPLPPSLRYLSGQNALIAAITKPDSGELVALQAIFLEEDSTGVWKKKRLTYGPARLGSVVLTEPDTKIYVAESVEDGLALAQMTGASVQAVPGANFMGGHFVPPSQCETVVLAPDNDEAGRKAIEKATPRLLARSLVVRVLLPQPGRDWCDELDDFEERQAIVEAERYA